MEIILGCILSVVFFGFRLFVDLVIVWVKQKPNSGSGIYFISENLVKGVCEI